MSTAKVNTVYVANFYHIKSTNGLFYYGVDYVRAQLQIPYRVLVRCGMEYAAAAHFPVDVLCRAPCRDTWWRS